LEKSFNINGVHSSRIFQKWKYSRKGIVTRFVFRLFPLQARNPYEILQYIFYYDMLDIVMKKEKPKKSKFTTQESYFKSKSLFSKI